MHKVSFSENADLPRLEHCRKLILSKVLSHPHKQEVRLDWATIGSNISYEMALRNPSLLVAETDKMVSSGEFTFSFRTLFTPQILKITIEKYEIRRRFIGGVYGFRAAFSLPEGDAEPQFLVSKSLVDLNTKLYAFCVLEQETKGLTDQASINIMSSW
jgi:hypothetical protein